jgi:hypothetical protein
LVYPSFYDPIFLRLTLHRRLLECCADAVVLVFFVTVAGRGIRQLGAHDGGVESVLLQIPTIDEVLDHLNQAPAAVRGWCRRDRLRSQEPAA